MSKKNRRPANLPYPNEWLSFQALSVNGESLVQYRIQDLPPGRFEDAVKHMTKYFLSDEPLCQSRKLMEHPRSIYEFQDIIRSAMIENKMTIACFCEGSNEIVGMNILFVKRQDEGSDIQDVCIYSATLEAYDVTNVTPIYHFQYQCPQINNIKTMGEFTMGQVDVFEHYGVSKYLTGLGISVSPQYRNRGIAKKLLEAQ